MKPPFRIGTTSFIYPDQVLPNVQRLAPRVDDVEILFFDVSNPIDLPSPEQLNSLAELKARFDLTYSLHTPLNVQLASSDEGERCQGIEMVIRAVRLAGPLMPEAYIVHVDRDDRQPIDAWRKAAGLSLEAIVAVGVLADQLCVETLDYDFALIEPVVAALGLSVALDVGHLQRDGRPLRDLVERNLHRTRIIHWHGVDSAGRDHRSLIHYPGVEAQWLMDRLFFAPYCGVVTLEVFRELDFEESLAAMDSWIKPRCGSLNGFEKDGAAPENSGFLRPAKVDRA